MKGVSHEPTIMKSVRKSIHCVIVVSIFYCRCFFSVMPHTAYELGHRSSWPTLLWACVWGEIRCVASVRASSVIYFSVSPTDHHHGDQPQVHRGGEQGDRTAEWLPAPRAGQPQPVAYQQPRQHPAATHGERQHTGSTHGETHTHTHTHIHMHKHTCIHTFWDTSSPCTYLIDSETKTSTSTTT